MIAAEMAAQAVTAHHQLGACLAATRHAVDSGRTGGMRAACSHLAGHARRVWLRLLKTYGS